MFDLGRAPGCVRCVYLLSFGAGASAIPLVAFVH
jgi:hypothetical protein